MELSALFGHANVPLNDGSGEPDGTLGNEPWAIGFSVPPEVAFQPTSMSAF